MHSKKVQSSNIASNSCSELCFNHPTRQDALRNMHKYPKTSKHAINYSHQELSDHFTLQPGGMNTHTLKLPSVVPSRIRLTTPPLLPSHTHTWRDTPTSHSSRTSHTNRSRPVGILQLGKITDEVAHPMFKVGTGFSQLSTALQIFSLPE